MNQTPRPGNRLADETSPYLLQHAHNPVDWYPWGDEAIQRSVEESKPIFLSIGYSACHWCHVMERESFENPEIADVLNQHFVCIKVDREERPDLDSLYMAAVQMLSGRGGWPMSVFLTPTLQPFYGGTYWPPASQHGMPGFDQVLAAVIDAWNNRREQAVQAAHQLTQRIEEFTSMSRSDGFALAHARLLTQATSRLSQSFDPVHGGFGSAPKFPHGTSLQLLLRVWHRTQDDHLLEMVRKTLDKMAAGGIYDHLAGGFARYSVDARWLVPHFEKMLYDNAMLTNAYLDGFLATQDRRYADIAQSTLTYVLNYLTDPVGGFHSTEDADSEGEEGKFYVWSKSQIYEHLQSDLADTFCALYDVTESGNFEGQSILNMPQSIARYAAQQNADPNVLSEEMAHAIQTLRAVRDQRIRPGKDDKILVNWNGLMIDAMARGGRILDRPEFIEAAARAADFLLTHLRDEEGQLLHCWRNQRARFPAYLDDYACLANGLLTLYETTFEERWIDEAVKLVETMRTRFRDDANDGFFYTSDQHTSLIVRTKDFHDSSTPSGNGMAAVVLTRLGKICGRADFLVDARGILDVAAELMETSPSAAGQLLIALDMQTGPFFEIAMLGDPSEKNTQAAIKALWNRYIPNRVLACRESVEPTNASEYLNAIFLGRVALYGSPSVFVCEKFTCNQPVSGKEGAIGKWGELVALGQTMPV